MGRYPFSVAVEAYLERIRPEPPFNSGYSPATYKEKSAKLRMLARLFNSWRDDGLIRTSDPLKMGEPEINFLLGHFDGRTLAYIDKLLDHLIVFFEDIGNPVLKRMRKQRKLPREEERDIETVGDAWFADAMAKLDTVDGWRGSVVRFSVVMYYSTGLRSKELRLARLTDLDTRAWTLTVTNPKGTGKWAGRMEKVEIFPSIRPHVIDFLAERETMLSSYGLDSLKVLPLVPQTEDGSFYMPDGWRNLRSKVFGRLGIEGDTRLLRRSFGQKLKDGGLPIEEISRTMRHKYTITTERYYARVRGEVAWKNAATVWESGMKVSVQKSD